MQEIIAYPKGLRLPLRDGYGMQTVSPILRTSMQSGRSKIRRLYLNTPTIFDVVFSFSGAEAALFEAWFSVALVSGTKIFEMPLKTPFGIETHKKCKFMDVYSGPTLIGSDLWRYAAKIESQERQHAGSEDLIIGLAELGSPGAHLLQKIVNKIIPEI